VPNISLMRRLSRSAFCLVAGSLSFVATANAEAPNVAAVGPLEQVNCTAKSVRVLGIEFKASETAGVSAICALGNPADLIYVAIAGSIDGVGQPELTTLTVLSVGEYVPGASPVYVSGLVTTVDPLTGQVTINGARAISTAAPPKYSSKLEILGTQPLLGGLILVDLIRTENDRESNEMQIASSSGSGRTKLQRDSSAGSGKLSSSGSGMLSSSGSGTLSSAGSGILSSSGSGMLSSSGSGTLSSSGSGMLSSAGSGMFSTSESMR
jgi:hypothetical protein